MSAGALAAGVTIPQAGVNLSTVTTAFNAMTLAYQTNISTQATATATAYQTNISTQANATAVAYQGNISTQATADQSAWQTNISTALKSGSISPTFSSGTFTATGSAQYSLTTSSGINVSAGIINTPELCFGANGCQTAPPGSGTIGGSGTTNYIPKFTAGTTLGNSPLISDPSGTSLTLPTASSMTVGGLKVNSLNAVAFSSQTVAVNGFIKLGSAYLQWGQFNMSGPTDGLTATVTIQVPLTINCSITANANTGYGRYFMAMAIDPFHFTVYQNDPGNSGTGTGVAWIAICY
jgi:hypothetical protein